MGRQAWERTTTVEVGIMREKITALKHHPKSPVYENRNFKGGPELNTAISAQIKKADPKPSQGFSGTTQAQACVLGF